MNLLKYLRRVFVLVIFLIVFSSNVPQVHGQGVEDLIPKLDVVIVVDESYSMWSETDIRKERIHAFNLLIDALGAFERSGDNVRVSVIAFGSAELTEVVLPFTPVNSGSVSSIKGAYQAFNDRLANPSDGAVVGLRWTDALYALELAEAQFTDPTNGHLSDHKPAIIVMSDGKPETEQINDEVSDFQNKLNTYIDDILVQAAKFRSDPGGLYYYEGTCEPLKKGWVPIYTIGMRHGASLPSDYREIWSRLAEQNGGDYYANPEGLTTDNLGNTYYQIYTDLICKENQLDTVVVPFVGEYQVSNLYSNILFTVLKENEGISVNIYRPESATRLSEEDPNVTVNKSLRDEVWSIQHSGSEAWAGTWRVELTGSGQVLFAYERFTTEFEINTLSPTSNFIKACEPLEILLRVQNSEGNAITDNVQGFPLSVRIPTGEERPLGEPERVGELFAYRFAETCIPGAYNFDGVATINFPDAGITTEHTWNQQITARADPYLAVVSPADQGQVFTTHALPLEVDIKVADKLDPARATQNPVVTAVFFQEGSQVLGPVPLHYDPSSGPARMKGEIPAGRLPEGEYLVEFKLEMRDNPTAEIAEAAFTMQAAIGPTTPTAIPPTATTVPPTAVPPTAVPPTAEPTPVPPDPVSLELIAGVVGGGGLLALLVGALLFLYNLPAMRALHLIHPDGTMQSIGRKWLGGKVAETYPFSAQDGTPIQLKFSPGQDTDGIDATKVTVMNNLPYGSTVDVDGTSLWAKGDSTQITEHSQWLVIDGQYHEIRVWS